MKQYRFVLFLFIMLLVSLLPLYADPSIDLHPGNSLFEEQEYDQAAAFFDNLVKIYPDSADISFYLGKSQLAAGDFKKAVNSLEKAVKIDEQQVDYYYVLGLAYARYINEVSILKKSGIAKKMLKAMQTAVRLDENHIDARVSLISYYLTAPGFAGGSVEEAKNHLSILMMQYPEKIFLIEGSFYERQKNYEKAERIYRIAVKMDKAPLNVFTLAGYYLRREQFDEAIPLLDEFLTMDLNWQDPKKAGAYFMLGMIYEKKKMQKKSEEAFQYALQNKPDKWMEKEIGKKLKAM